MMGRKTRRREFVSFSQVVMESLEQRQLLCTNPYDLASHSSMVTAASTHTALAINAGGANFTDADGQLWSADTGYVGGATISPTPPVSVADSVDDRLYSDRRYSGAQFRYDVPTVDGEYVLQLNFVEASYNVAGKRLFNVVAEGQQILTGFDIYAAGGYRAAVVREFVVTVTGGALNLNFIAIQGNAIISAIKLTYVGPGEDPGEPQQDDFVIDNDDAQFTGTWTASSSFPGFYGSNYRHDGAGSKGLKEAKYVPNFATAGLYEVLIRYAANSNRASNVPYVVLDANGATTTLVNQKSGGATWMTLGEYQFNTGTAGNVTIKTTGTSGYVIADAVRFVYKGEPAAPVAPTSLTVLPASASSLRLAWTDASLNESGFKIERRLQGSTSFAEIAQVGRNTNSYLDSGRVAGTTYEYRVRATNSVGDSAYSPIASGTPSGETAFTQIAWSSLSSPSPVTRSEALKGVVDGKLYVFGGFGAGSAGPIVRSDVYDPKTNKWTRIKDLPARLTHVGVTVVGREIWFAGGYTGTGTSGYAQTFATRNVWIYNVDSNTYRAGPLLPLARGSGALVYTEGYLYFFNGVDSSRKDRGEGWKLKVGETTWTAIKTNPNPRSHLGFAALEGMVYAIGGQHNTDALLTTQTDSQVYNPSNNTWTQLAVLPRGVSHISSSTFTMGSRIIAIGGEYAYTKGVADVLAFDPKLNTWTRLTSVPYNSNSAVADVIDGWIYNGTGSSTAAMMFYVGKPIT